MSALTIRQQATLDEALRRLLRDAGYPDFVPNDVSLGELIDSGSTSSSPPSVLDLPEIATAFTPTTSSGDITTSMQFIPSQNRDMTGVKFYWDGFAGESLQVKATLYAGDGTVMANKTITVSAAGVYTATFDTPVSVAPGVLYFAAIYQGISFQTGISSGNLPTVPMFAGGDIVLVGSFFTNGDALPDSSPGGQLYPIIPILQYD